MKVVRDFSRPKIEKEKRGTLCEAAPNVPRGFGVRQPAAAFLSQPAGGESLSLPKHGDGVSAKRLAWSRMDVVCDSALRATPAGWRGESGSRLPHSTALRALVI